MNKTACHRRPNQVPGPPDPGFAQLLATTNRLVFEPHRIGHLLDKTGRYEKPLDREFPFLIRLFHYRSHHYTQGLTWQDRLELFLPLDGPCRVRMGDADIELGPGDLLVMDNKKVAGMTFVAYVTHVRLANAARLLKETAMSVAEIASQVGFTDQSYFDTRFRCYFGQTPMSYRQGIRM